MIRLDALPKIICRPKWNRNRPPTTWNDKGRLPHAGKNELLDQDRADRVDRRPEDPRILYAFF
jgi:hypothetical protein